MNELIVGAAFRTGQMNDDISATGRTITAFFPLSQNCLRANGNIGRQALEVRIVLFDSNAKTKKKKTLGELGVFKCVRKKKYAVLEEVSRLK
jgi:hypothetical protein